MNNSPPCLELRGVSKSFGNGGDRREILRNVSLELAEGEFVAIVGASGAGKSTLVKLLAGLLEPDRGAVRFVDATATRPGPERGLVFQNYSLLPWLNVHDNIALGVDQVFRDWTKERRREHVRRFVELVNLTAAARKYPRELSGGMRQRVSLARTLATLPRVLLLDEPLSALDALTRGSLQQEIASLWREHRTTCVMITGDIDEAILLADRVIPLTAAPAATLGPSFAVSLARPRDPKQLNHDPTFRRLRSEITQWLIASRRQTPADAAPRREPIKLPNLVPQAISRRGASSPAATG